MLKENKDSQIEKDINKLCPGLSIMEGNFSDYLIKKEIDWLYKDWMSKNSILYLDHNHPQFVFLGQLPGFKRGVGFCTLRAYSTPKTNDGISCLTRAGLEDHNIATAMVTHAVEFSKNHLDIESLFAHVIEGSFSERIIKKLKFTPKSMITYPSWNNITYTLKTN